MSDINLQEMVSAVRNCLPDDLQSADLSEPLFEGKEWQYVKECLDSGWVSSAGQYVDLFEQKLAEFTGAGFAVVTVNGTAALHIALLLAGVQSGDEVLTPALTFVGTTNAIAYCNAVPHFVDSDPQTLGVDARKLREYLATSAELTNGVCHNRATGKPIRALVVMHTFGHPVDLDTASEVCEEFRVKLIEDAAEAIGSYYKGVHVGHRGLLGCLSFNGNKIITTGGGGAILTNDEELARRAKHLTTTAKLPHPWRYDHDSVGYNYPMPNLNAALGCAQLDQLPVFLDHKRNLASRYGQALADVQGVKFFGEPPGCRSNYWLNALLLDESAASQQKQALTAFHDNGLRVRPAWTLQNKLPMFQDAPSMNLEMAESIESRLINLPSSASLARDAA